MAAGRMARHIDSVGVAPIVGNVAHGPGKSGGDIFDLRRVLMLGGQPITRHDGDKPFARVTVSERRIVRTIPALPGPTVNEEEDRGGGLSLRAVNIQLVL